LLLYWQEECMIWDWFHHSSECDLPYFDCGSCLIINEHAPLLTLNVLFGIHQSFTLLVCCSLGGSQHGHSSSCLQDWQPLVLPLLAALFHVSFVLVLFSSSFHLQLWPFFMFILLGNIPVDMQTLRLKLSCELLHDMHTFLPLLSAQDMDLTLFLTFTFWFWVFCVTFLITFNWYIYMNVIIHQQVDWIKIFMIFKCHLWRGNYVCC